MNGRVFWRLAVPRALPLAFRGSLAPGRWNLRGRPVYAASSIALAALERLIYYDFGPAADLHPRQHLFRLTVPPEVTLESWLPDQLPAAWQAMRPGRMRYAPPTALQERGDRWYTSQRTSGVVVPSAHVPEEPNLLLNPAHHEFPRIAIEYVREFHYDPRLLGRLREAPDA